VGAVEEREMSPVVRCCLGRSPWYSLYRRLDVGAVEKREISCKGSDPYSCL
jgi:hypothetical protein